MKRIAHYPKWLLVGLVGFLLLLSLLNVLFPLPLSQARAVSDTVADKEARWLAGFTIEDGRWRIKADLSEIDPRFIDYLLTIEDSRFYRHSGVDLLAVTRAARSWGKAGRPVSGASTITMQLVRQIEPRERTLGAKIIESIRALQYDFWLSKSEILELYLSHVSYGGNIEGVHAASMSYFGKPPYQLTDAEIALLIAIPQAPEARRPDLRRAGAKVGRDIILAKLESAGKLTHALANEARAEPVLGLRRPIPQTAWLTARDLSRRNVSQSTLNMDIQNTVESVATRFVKALDENANTAMIVVENETMAVRAHVASADRDRAGGWINMTERARSPGSTLKPFIYGLAMDDGYLRSGTFIHDAPTRFGRYQPENFNRRYHGNVRIREALQHSLNVPAVAVLDKLGSARLEDTLVNAGADIQRLGSDLEGSGLAVALGGLGITLNDMAVLYAALANGGVAKPLVWNAEGPGGAKEGAKAGAKQGTGVRILSAQTTAEITGILHQAPTPGGRVPAWLTQNAAPIAYKTGTSYGFRDAWAAGYSDQYTVIVWVGRPDGAPRPGQTGRVSAAPLLYDIFAVLPNKSTDKSYQRDRDAPLGLKDVKSLASARPQILFPPDGSELLATEFGNNSRGFSLSARSEVGNVVFYVDGSPIAREGQQSIWRPSSPGFYTITAVDSLGRDSRVNIEVISLDQLAQSTL